MTSEHRNDWDRRYDQERFFYGEDPHPLLARELPGLPVGKALFLAEGEGRNAVYAAGLGHAVTAWDSSAVGRRKALELAARRGVEIDYILGDLIEGDWDAESWDLVVMGYAHLDPQHMADVHRRVVTALRPGGHLLHVSFSKAQFGRNSGGPPRLELLHDLDELKRQYAGLEFLRAEEKEIELDEGKGHRGSAMVIEMVGVKPAAGD